MVVLDFNVKKTRGVFLVSIYLFIVEDFKSHELSKYRFNKILLIQISFFLSKIKSKCKKDIMYKGKVLVLDIL